MRTHIAILTLTALMTSSAHAMMPPEDAVEDTQVKTIRLHIGGGVADVVLHHKRNADCVRVGQGWSNASITLQAGSTTKIYTGCWTRHDGSAVFVGRGTSMFEPMTIAIPGY